MMDKNTLIYVAGHNGLAGSAIVRRLQASGYHNLIFRRSSELNLIDPAAAEAFFQKYCPTYVFMCAGTVGGIVANQTYPVDFTHNNSMMVLNVLASAHRANVQKLVYLGSSCIYPRESPQPIKEEYLLTGPLEPTNEGYALAKIMGIKLCAYYRRQYGCDFISAMPSNLYGLNNNYHPEYSHVIGGLIRRFHEAKVANAPEVVVWGTGKALREFTYSDDFADGVIFAMNHYSDSVHINVGTGKEISITELAYLVAETIGYTKKIVFDTSKPDGTLRKLMDNSRLAGLGWNPSTPLKQGLRQSYADFLKYNTAR